MNEMKMKAKKTRNELKVSDSKTYPLKNEERMKNGEERKTFTDLLTETSQKHLGLDFLHGNNFFHPKQLKCIARGVRDLWNSLPWPIYRKRGEKVAANLAQASSARPGELGCFLQKQPYFETVLEGPNSKFWKLLFASPHFDKLTPLLS